MRGRVISVIIPVYKESPYLEKLIKCLSAQHADKEIIVIIDEPTKASLELVNKFKEIKFILNRKRMGKVAALNKAAKITRGEILLFLDADVEINDNEFLKKLELEMRDAEFIDIKKVVVKDSFLSRMTYYEYLGFNIGSYLLSRFLRKCPAVNGSAFAVKRYVFEKIGGFRKVIVEDVDIATRAFVNGYAFKYLPNIHVYNHVPKTWWAWIEQRKRWSIGTALWFREWYKEMIGIAIKKPEIVLPALLFVFPAVVIVIVNIFIPNLWVYKLLSLVFIFFAIKFNIMFPLLMLTT
ncbi:MAG TPA: glycosyltransferase family 2 protein, partial [Candidatus Aenigmarchaeota archaeon]|nr:glycosyltransferase family 2 protein [Candidatus Aenigmarchaeota archaeon]